MTPDPHRPIFAGHRHRPRAIAALVAVVAAVAVIVMAVVVVGLQPSRIAPLRPSGFRRKAFAATAERFAPAGDGAIHMAAATNGAGRSAASGSRLGA